VERLRNATREDLEDAHGEWSGAAAELVDRLAGLRLALLADG
jgi:hypothetical protein